MDVRQDVKYVSAFLRAVPIQQIQSLLNFRQSLKMTQLCVLVMDNLFLTHIEYKI